MDPITTVGTGLAVLGSKEVIEKLLGPTADYVGNEARNLVDRCNINLDKIFIKAVKILGKDIEKPGLVPPRVLKNIIEEGRFCEDDLVAEYYAGIMASSRNESLADDRGVYYLSIIRSLSAFQIKLHYLIYFSVREFYFEYGGNLGLEEECIKMPLFIPDEVIALAFGVEESSSFRSLISHSLSGLHQNWLINPKFSFGHKEHLSSIWSDVPSGGLVVRPSLLGSELFMWAECKESKDGHRLWAARPPFNSAILPIKDGIQALRKKANKSRHSAN